MRQNIESKFIYFIFLLFTIILISGCNKTTNDLSTKSNENLNTAEFVKIPKSEISKEMKVYEYDTFGAKVRYFAVIGTDGEIHVAFDACDVCGGTKGYRQTGEDVVCNQCGRAFKIIELGTKNKGGGCWPSHLNFNEDEENIYISQHDLSKASSVFV